MWDTLWRSMGKATGVVVTTVAGAPAGVQGVLAGLLQKASGDGRSPILEAVERRAECIARILRERGVVPDRIGIDGLPGSGKITLARALAPKLDLRWLSLDYKDLNVPRNLERKGVIVEHHRLLRTQDADRFDVILYIRETPERARIRTVRRRRGVILAALLDYHKLGKVGELAFDVCQAEPVVIPDSNLILKIKPPGGFRAIESIVRRLREAGLDTAGMSKEAMLFLLALGKPEHGLTAYYSPFPCFACLGGVAGWLRGTNPPP